jgi:hypothetical protein
MFSGLPLNVLQNSAFLLAWSRPGFLVIGFLSH